MRQAGLRMRVEVACQVTDEREVGLLGEVARSGRFVGGEFTARFEREFAAWWEMMHWWR